MVSESEDPFAESDQWLAALARQLLRAHQARDPKAQEVTAFYLKEFLQLTLRRHLAELDPGWRDTRRWFDGITADPEFPSPGRVRMRGKACWVLGQEQWFDEPLDFEMELCPESGVLWNWTVRFGDTGPHAESSRAERDALSGEWAYTVTRRSSDGASPNVVS